MNEYYNVKTIVLKKKLEIFNLYCPKLFQLVLSIIQLLLLLSTKIIFKIIFF